MNNQKFAGFVQEDWGRVTRKICAGILKVLNEPFPTEDKVRRKVWEMGYKITSLNFSPHPGVKGEIRGVSAVEFSFRAICGNREISGEGNNFNGGANADKSVA